MGELPDARPGADDLSGIVRWTPGAVTSLDLEGLVLGGALDGSESALVDPRDDLIHRDLVDEVGRGVDALCGIGLLEGQRLSRAP